MTFSAIICESLILFLFRHFGMLRIRVLMMVMSLAAPTSGLVWVSFLTLSTMITSTITLTSWLWPMTGLRNLITPSKLPRMLKVSKHTKSFLRISLLHYCDNIISFPEMFVVMVPLRCFLDVLKTSGISLFQQELVLSII